METSQVSALRGNLGVCQLPSGLTAAPSFLKIFKSSLRVRKIQGLKIRVDFLLYLLLRWADKQTSLLGVARKLCGRDGAQVRFPSQELNDCPENVVWMETLSSTWKCRGMRARALSECSCPLPYSHGIARSRKMQLAVY